MSMVFSRFLLGGALAICAAAAASAQDSVAQFYRGKTITLYVGFGAGGGYDEYARLLARYMGRYIPGHPDIVPQNMPGAGSNKAAGYVYSVAPKDGTAIAALAPGATLAPLLSDLPVQHDPARFIFVGSANSEIYLCVARADSPIKSFQDVLTREMIVGASNEGGTTRDMPAMLDNILGAKIRIVTGYSSTREIALAIERKEIDGLCGFGYTSLQTVTPQWVANHTVRIIAQESVEGSPVLNRMGVPRTVDFARSKEDRNVMALVYSQAVFGRPYVLPPGVPPERVSALRKAFTAALADPALRAEAGKVKLDIEAISGEDLQKMIGKLYAMPARISARAKQALIYRR